MSNQAFKRVRRHLKMEVNRKPLDSWAWPGGYPMYYLTEDGGVLCPACVNAEIESIDQATCRGRQWDSWKLADVDVNYEDADLHCCHCAKRIPSAYCEEVTT